MTNYTNIKVVFKDYTELYINEDELIVFKMSGDYQYIAYLNDKDELHRLDGPAYERFNGYKAWWVNDKRHRLDGPAIEEDDGEKVWYVDGKNYSKKNFEKEYWIK